MILVCQQLHQSIFLAGGGGGVAGGGKVCGASVLFGERAFLSPTPHVRTMIHIILLYKKILRKKCTL